MKADKESTELKNAVAAVNDATKNKPATEQLAIALVDFVKTDRFSPSADGTNNIRLSVKAAHAILTDKSKESRDVKLGAIEKLLDKISKDIEEDYVHQDVSANVGPPPGTPNAISGMNPDAISDPELRKQYLESIKLNQDKNLKNSQQYELRNARSRIALIVAGMITTEPDGLTREEALARFGKNKPVKAMIEEYTR